jgi:hypothetical protein
MRCAEAHALKRAAPAVVGHQPVRGRPVVRGRAVVIE